jgi:hypothetical protein
MEPLSSPADAKASRAARTASTENLPMVIRWRGSMHSSEITPISPPIVVLRSRRSMVRGPMPERPSHMACQIEAAFEPIEQIPPSPVMTMRVRVTSGLGFRELFDGVDDVADILE